MKKEQALNLKTLTKRSAWDIQENDVFRLWKESERDVDLRDNKQHYFSTLATAFDMEEIKIDKAEIVKKYKDRGFKVGVLKGIGGEESKWAIKKRQIARVADLTTENIHCLSAPQLLEIINRNFGGGWSSLSQNTQKIIESRFNIATTTLPHDRLHNKGGIYDKMVADDYDVLEIPKGTWVEVIFAKENPDIIIPTKQETSRGREETDYDLDRDRDKDKDGDTDGFDFDSDDSDYAENDAFEDGVFDDDYTSDYSSPNDELTLDDVVAAEDGE